MIGINANGIDDMRFAIRVYVENIESHLNQVLSEAEDTYAFKGAYANSIVEYVKAVCDVVKSLTSQLLIFSDKLVNYNQIIFYSLIIMDIECQYNFEIIHNHLQNRY